jgi:hypothetical protein
VGSGKFFLLVVGIIFLIVGLIVGLGLPWFISQDSARVSAIAVSNLASLNQQQPGSEVVFEAQISPASEEQFDDYVAYRQERQERVRRDGRYQTEWRNELSVTPPLKVELDNETILITNDTYNLGTLQNQREVRINNEPRRISGIRQNDPVVVIGKLRSNNDGITVEAEVVSVGTKSDYLEGQNTAWWIAVLLGSVFSLVGSVLIWFGLRR